jgi:plasmid stabilization system protein ParE
MKVRELTVALAELDEAIAHYRAIDARLAARLLDEIDAGKQAIERFPNAWKRLPSGVRAFPLRRFPYTLLYMADGDEILIVAYAHQSREPRYWEDRL